MERSFGLYLEMASVFCASLFSQGRDTYMLGSAESCKLVTGQIVMRGQGEVRETLVAAWPVPPPSPLEAVPWPGKVCLRKVASTCACIWVHRAQKPSAVLQLRQSPEHLNAAHSCQQQTMQRLGSVKQGVVHLHSCCGLEVWVGKNWHN